MSQQVGAIGELLAAGKIRHWGLSNETAYGVVMMCETAKRLGVAPPISIQNDFSPFLRLFAGETAEACAPRNCNLGLLAYGVLAGGALSGASDCALRRAVLRCAVRSVAAAGSTPLPLWYLRPQENI